MDDEKVIRQQRIALTIQTIKELSENLIYLSNLLTDDLAVAEQLPHVNSNQKE